MLALIKKGVLMGLGAIILTKEKVEQVVDELVKKGELTKDDGPQAVKNLLKKAEEQEKEFFDRISAEVKKAIAKMDISTKKDIERLEKKIESIKK